MYESLSLSELEEYINTFLNALQNYILAGRSEFMINLVSISLLHFLHNLPHEYKTLNFLIYLDPTMPEINRTRERLANYGFKPICKDWYDIPILVPRMTPVDDLGTTHGSYLRERTLSLGEIKTIKFETWARDKITNNIFTITINYQGIGLFASIDTRIFLFPRLIDRIYLSAELPSYLDKDQAAFVNRFYSETIKLTSS